MYFLLSALSIGFIVNFEEPMTRFELVTSSLPRKRSTPELHRQKKERETGFEPATFSLEG